MNRKRTPSAARPATGTDHSGQTPPPSPVLVAAGIAILQSLTAITFGLFLVGRLLTGAHNNSMVFSTATPAYVGVGSAVFITVCFGFVILSAIGMVKGKRWGRGAVVLLQFILVASSFQMMSGGALVLGAVVLVSALIALVLLLFVPASLRWAAAHHHPLGDRREG